MEVFTFLLALAACLSAVSSFEPRPLPAHYPHYSRSRSIQSPSFTNRFEPAHSSYKPVWSRSSPYSSAEPTYGKDFRQISKTGHLPLEPLPMHKNPALSSHVRKLRNKIPKVTPQRNPSEDYEPSTFNGHSPAYAERVKPKPVRSNKENIKYSERPKHSKYRPQKETDEKKILYEDNPVYDDEYHNIYTDDYKHSPPKDYPRNPVKPEKFTKQPLSYADYDDYNGNEIEVPRPVRKPVRKPVSKPVRKPVSPNYEPESATFKPYDMNFDNWHAQKTRDGPTKEGPIDEDPHDYDYTPDEHSYHDTFPKQEGVVKSGSYQHSKRESSPHDHHDRSHHGGSYHDNNGKQFLKDARTVTHGGKKDGRLAFQIHGQQGPHSYKFGFDTGKGKHRHFRYEERDGYGEVRGRYGFVDKHGKLQVVNYSAHPKHGYSTHP